jgi:hypothetical protein
MPMTTQGSPTLYDCARDDVLLVVSRHDCEHAKNGSRLIVPTGE